MPGNTKKIPPSATSIRRRVWASGALFFESQRANTPPRLFRSSLPLGNALRVGVVSSTQKLGISGISAYLARNTCSAAVTVRALGWIQFPDHRSFGLDRIPGRHRHDSLLLVRRLRRSANRFSCDRSRAKSGKPLHPGYGCRIASCIRRIGRVDFGKPDPHGIRSAHDLPCCANDRHQCRCYFFGFRRSVALCLCSFRRGWVLYFRHRDICGTGGSRHSDGASNRQSRSDEQRGRYRHAAGFGRTSLRGKLQQLDLELGIQQQHPHSGGAESSCISGLQLGSPGWNEKFGICGLR